MLDRHLLHVARTVWMKTRRIAKLAYKANGEVVNERECRHFARVAAFLAFADCGGSEFETFSWVQHKEQLFKRAHYHMLQLLRNSDRTLGRDTQDRKRRLEAAAVDEYRWDAWEQPLRNRQAATVHGPRSNRYVPVADVPDYRLFNRREYKEPWEPEQRLHEEQLHRLGEALAQELSDEDFTLLEKHYFQNMSQRALASALGLHETCVCIGHEHVPRSACNANQSGRS